MLGMKSYSKEYVAACRARVASGLAVYRKHIGKNGSSEMEHRFFNDQVLVLDHMFVHRLTGIEGKDGTPLNEVRVLCNSLQIGMDLARWSTVSSTTRSWCSITCSYIGSRGSRAKMVPRSTRFAFSATHSSPTRASHIRSEEHTSELQSL